MKLEKIIKKTIAIGIITVGVYLYKNYELKKHYDYFPYTHYVIKGTNTYYTIERKEKERDSIYWYDLKKK